MILFIYHKKFLIINIIILTNKLIFIQTNISNIIRYKRFILKYTIKTINKNAIFLIS